MSTSQKPFMTRSSLACLRCRTRHQKCDAKKPQCSRCIQSAGKCEYTKSRRGGSVDIREWRRKSVNELALAPPNSQIQTDILEHDPLALSGSSPQRLGVLSTPTSGLAGSPRTRDGSQNLQSDALIDAYYTNFHKFHHQQNYQSQILDSTFSAPWQYPRQQPPHARRRLCGRARTAQQSKAAELAQ